MFPLENSLLFLIGAFFAEIIGTIGGFGSATVLTAFAAFFMKLKIAIFFVAIFHLAGTLVRGAYFFRAIRPGVLWRFLAPDLAATAFGAFAIAIISEQSVRLAFGAFLLLYAALGLIWPSRARLPERNWVLYAGGAFSGFLAGLLGTGGAARAMTLQAFGLPRNAYLGTSAASAVVTDILRLGIYFWVGIFAWTASGANFVLWLAVIAAAGALLGSRIAEKIPERPFAFAVYVLLALAGLNFLL